MLTGQFIKSTYLHNKPHRKVLYMVLAAVALMIVGQIWNLNFPINKYLWSSSFVCFVGGLSLLLFSLFYLVIDIWKFNKWTGFFVVIGMNSITIYLAERIIDFNAATKFVFSGLVGLFPANWTELMGAVAFFATAWIFLYFLYKNKIFLKV